jgi:hypothetical protein
MTPNSDTEKKFWISIDSCPHGVFAICLEDTGGSMRLTARRCCGRWTTQTEFPLGSECLRRVIAELACALGEMEAQSDDTEL